MTETYLPEFGFSVFPGRPFVAADNLAIVMLEKFPGRVEEVEPAEDKPKPKKSTKKKKGKK